MGLGFYLHRAQSLLGQLLYWSLVAAVAGLVLVYFCRVSGVGGHGPAKTERLLTGQAHRPYVYRALLPLTAGLLSPMLDPNLATRVGVVSERILGDGFFLRRLDGAQFPSQAVLILAMMYVSLYGLCLAAFLLLLDLSYLPWVRYLGPLALVMGMTLFMQFGYIYDFTSVFMFVSGLLLMWRRRWGAFMVVLAIGTLNKETTIFLCLIFMLYFWDRLARRRFVALLSTQLAIYGLVQGILRLVYRQNPGTTAQWHLPDQVGAVTDLARSDPYRLALMCLILTFVAALIAYGWGQKPEILRTGFAVLPLFVALFIFWGYPYEIRVMLEVYPLVAILMLPPQLIRPAMIAAADLPRTAPGLRRA